MTGVAHPWPRPRSGGLDGPWLLRAAASVVLLVAVGWAATIDGPLSPHVGPTWVTDAPNYFAAAERLNAGRSLYALSPGDRPLVLDEWIPAPLLSPPLIAVLWRPLALAPLEPIVIAWTWIGCVLLVGSCLWLVWRTGTGSALGVLLLSVPLALTAWTGNLQVVLTPALCLTWVWSRAGHAGRVGAVAGIGSVVKLAPAPLFVWMLATGQLRALRAGILVGIGAAVVSVAGAGVAAHLDYARVASEVSRIGGTVLSAGGMATAIGVPDGLRSLAAPVVLLLGSGVVIAVRQRPGLAFAAAIVTGLLGLTVVNLTNVTMLLAAFVPFGATIAGGQAGATPTASADGDRPAA